MGKKQKLKNTNLKSPLVFINQVQQTPEWHEFCLLPGSSQFSLFTKKIKKDPFLNYTDLNDPIIISMADLSKMVMNQYGEMELESVSFKSINSTDSTGAGLKIKANSDSLRLSFMYASLLFEGDRSEEHTS